MAPWGGPPAGVVASGAQEQQTADINIVAEKCAFEGVTRFEDRYRLPLSISVNTTAYAAKLLAEVRRTPFRIPPYLSTLLAHISGRPEVHPSFAVSHGMGHSSTCRCANLPPALMLEPRGGLSKLL